MYTLRVHEGCYPLSTVAIWVRHNTMECLIVREEANREHFHAIFTIRKKIEQFRKDFRKEFPELKGNSGYSLKDVKSQIGIEDYLCKGEAQGSLPDVIEASPIWTEEKVKGHHESYWKRHEGCKTEDEANHLAKTGNDTVILSGTINTLSKLKVRTPTAVEKIAARLRREDPERIWTYHQQSHRKEVHQLMMRHLGDVGKTFDKLILKRIFNGVWLQLAPQEVTDYWEDSIVNFLD